MIRARGETKIFDPPGGAGDGTARRVN